MHRGVLGALLMLSWSAAQADYLEVRRVTNIYESADRSSEVLAVVGRGGEDDSGILLIDREQPREGGYLRVRLPNGPGYGYVYRTSGRLYKDFKGRFTPYDRADYKHWIDADRDCENTRDEVLVRDATGPVKQSKVGSRCKVTAGSWNDPYTGTVFTDAAKLDVDHMVPLKNAHMSGAWAWSAKRKQDYANLLEDPVHLLPVSAGENRKKGDKGPDRYLPPNEAHHCQYVQNWLHIKYEWGLDVPPAEQARIESVLSACEEE